MAAANSSSCGYSEASQGQNPDWQRHNPQKTQLSPSDLELRSAHCMQTQSEKEPVQAMNLKMYDSQTNFYYFYSV